ncbi:hypothetical protein FOY51_04880 [Antrihabitans cavernicola]|uniref:YkuD domain-containing protein n=2 Tax=Antrihabitans cavernicola TaxID=2495913 RepID=A0A5A7SDW4_9NOCA|nr:hypothetical protein FOY51_04880 [Spelaeibacter cavernicola]
MVALFALVLAPTAGAQPSTPWFDNRVGAAVQVVSVRGDGGTGATVEAWQRGLDGWDRVIAPIAAFVGSDGIAPQAVDGVPATPAGVFALPSVFGTGPAPGGFLPYRQVGPNDWWDGDVQSPTYNTHQVCAPGTCPFDENESERLAIPEYRYAVVMGVNAARTPGGGGAFFMHVSDGEPTDGCVSMTEGALVGIIRWLLPGAVVAIE